MRKKNYNFIIVLGVLILILFSSLNFLTILTPKTPSSVLDNYVNKYYLPTIEQTRNLDKCTNANINFGTSFSPNLLSIPSASSSCIYYSSESYFKSKKSTSKTGKCSDLGQEFKLSGNNVLSSLFLIRRGNDFVICKDKSRGGYDYSVLSKSSKFCSVKYPIPKPEEKEGKYYCDGKRIYNIPCGGKSKILIETCSLGCEYTQKQIEPGSSINIIKCKGDYKPNLNICSLDGRAFYSSDSSGNLTIKQCSSCSGNRCIEIKLTQEKYCKLIKGGKNDINIFFYNSYVMPEYGLWILDELKTRAPFSEFSYNLYEENPKGYCSTTINQRQRDLMVGFEDIPGGYFGWGQPPGPNSINPYKMGDFRIDMFTAVRKWDFLLFHELGHIYTRAGHTNDNSIMDQDGGSRQFYPYQIDIIRKNLNSTK